MKISCSVQAGVHQLTCLQELFADALGSLGQGICVHFWYSPLTPTPGETGPETLKIMKGLLLCAFQLRPNFLPWDQGLIPPADPNHSKQEACSFSSPKSKVGWGAKGGSRRYKGEQTSSLFLSAHCWALNSPAPIPHPPPPIPHQQLPRNA